MSFLKLVGVAPPPQGSYWVSGLLKVWPAGYSSDFTDGTRRAVYPILGQLVAGTHFETLGGGDVYLPGADIGVTADPPYLQLLFEYTDNLGHVYRSEAIGKIYATSSGQYNVNSPVGVQALPVTNPGANPPGALTTNDIGSSVPSMAAFNALGAPQSGTRANRLLYPTGGLTRPTPWYETDHQITVTFWPGVGWRGPNSENIDNPPPATTDPTSF